MRASAECANSVAIPMESVSAYTKNDLELAGSCTPAKRSFLEKSGDDVACGNCAPPNLSSAKLANRVKKE